MKVYISGAITGTKDYMERFEKAEQALTNRGHDVINPAKILSHLPVNTKWSDYMQIALILEGLCDKVYFLKNWEYSMEAKEEMKKAITDEMMIEME